jgi:hypothetical protein
MVTRRFEIRLDPQREEHVEHVAEEEGLSMTDAFRRLLDRGWDDWLKERRRLAVERIAAMEIEEMPDPEELNRQLDSTYDVDLP